jgi:hypothetical protein
LKTDNRRSDHKVLFSVASIETFAILKSCRHRIKFGKTDLNLEKKVSRKSKTEDLITRYYLELLELKHLLLSTSEYTDKKKKKKKKGATFCMRPRAVIATLARF